jgi:hypothetical protein
MREQGRRRLSHATVVAYAALFVALGGTAVAVEGRIGSKEIKNGAVASEDLRRDAVTDAKLADDSVSGEEVAEPLGLEETATSTTRVVVDPGPIDGGECVYQEFPVGYEPDQSVAVMPVPQTVRSFFSDGLIPVVGARSPIQGNLEIGICNVTNVNIGSDPGGLPVQVALFD